MISQLLRALIDSDPLYVAKRTADTRRYIMTVWRKAHDDLLDENAVALFLCDPLCGSLTPEQRVFAGRCRDEMNSVYGETLFRLVQCWVMVRRGMVCAPSSCRTAWSISCGGARRTPSGRGYSLTP